MSSILNAAHNFMLSNARLLERHLFAFLFQEGDRQPVLAALLAYQNADGGFGNALEPDKRTNTSQPIDQEVALHILDEIGFERAIAQQVCAFLETITIADGGVPFVLPTVRNAPRAPWWDTELAAPPAAFNPTASIAAFLHKHAVAHPWLAPATDFCWQQLETAQLTGGHDFLCAFPFLEAVPDRARAERVFQQVGEQLLASDLVAYEPDTPGYVLTPLQYAPSPTSIARQLFDTATIQKHLDALVQNQQPDGGWRINWSAVTPACEQEYRGIMTLNVLKTLQAYDHLG